MARYQPKTLAKTLSYISYTAPSEHGLFWDSDGRMPWKDLYWVLQEDESLRFVRETHIREILYLGISLPFILDGSSLRLVTGYPAPELPIVFNLPERLYYACQIKQFPVIRDHGLLASRRAYVALAADRDLAMRMARRRAKEPILVEVMARSAAESGVQFRQAGPQLFLVESIPVEHLLLPKLRDDVLAAILAESRDSRAAKEKKSIKAQADASPGSFMMGAVELERIYGGKDGVGKSGDKAGTGRNWKKESRKERRKRIP